MAWRRDLRRRNGEKTIARWNGRLLLYGLTPIILLGPFVHPHEFVWWHVPVSVAIAIANIFISRSLIHWGKGRGKVGEWPLR